MKALQMILISLITVQLMACNSSSSDGGSTSAQIPTNIISGEVKSSQTTSVYYADLAGRGSSCSTGTASDSYVETDHFMVFGQEGIQDYKKQLVGQYAENALQLASDLLGYTPDEVINYRAHYTPKSYATVHYYWTQQDRNDPGFTVFEMSEPFLQGFSDMTEDEKDIAMYQYWIGLTKSEQTDALNRIHTNYGWPAKTADEYPSYAERMNVCITLSGNSGVGFDFGFEVLDPTAAIGTTTDGIQGYEQLINHEMTHTLTAIVTRNTSGSWAYWFTEGLPEYVSGHSPASNAKSLGINVVRDRISKDVINFSEYPTFHFAVKYLIDDLGNGSASIGELLLKIRNDDQRNGAVSATGQVDPVLGISYDYLRAFETSFTDIDGSPISYSDYIDIYEDLLN